MRIGKIASSAEYRMDEQFKNGQFWEPKFGFPKWKNSSNLLIFDFKSSKSFQFEKFRKFSIWKISKISKSGQLQKFAFWKVLEICNL